MFDAVVLDPPTFSQSKEHGTFRAEKDYGKLVTAALPVLKPGGVLLASTNAADWPPEDFLAEVEVAVHGVETENSATTLRPATSGFSHQPRRTGLFENGMVEDWLNLAARFALESAQT